MSRNGILITGSSGFVGRNLLRRVVPDKRFSPIVLLTSNIERLNSLLKSDGIEADDCKIIGVDISSPKEMLKVSKEINKIAYVVHLAACTKMFSSLEELRRANVLGSLNTARLAVEIGAKKFIFASSIEAVGALKQGESPADEKIKPKPINNYGISKLEAERELTKFFENVSDAKAILLRIGHVYGGNSSFLTKDICDQIKTNSFVFRCLPYFANSTIQPIHIEDLIDAIELSLSFNSVSNTTIFHIAEKKNYTLRRIFEIANEKVLKIPDRSFNMYLKFLYVVMMEKITGRGGMLSYFYASPPRICRSISVEKAKLEMGFEAKISYEGRKDEIG